MALYDFVTGAVLNESPLDTLASQSVIRCISTGRPSSPVVGMTIYETDTDFVRRWDGGGWITDPKGLLVTATGVGTGSSGGSYFINSNVDVNGSELTFTGYDTENYRYSWVFPFGGNTAGNAFSVQPYRDDGSGYTAVGTQYDIPIGVAAANFPVAGHHDFNLSPSGGHGTCKVKLMVDGPGIGSGLGRIVSGGRFSLDHVRGLA